MELQCQAVTQGIRLCLRMMLPGQHTRFGFVQLALIAEGTRGCAPLSRAAPQQVEVRLRVHLLSWSACDAGSCGL